VQYLSPEQASGKSASPTTDIYSLGIVAYESLAGRRPFTGESQVAIAMAQINETPPDLPSTVSEPVRNLVFACLAKNPADRPASAAHLARAATALRRGDVAAAAASVPAILAGITPTAATMLMPGSGNNQATTILPATLPATRAEASAAAAAEKKQSTRSPWTWPLLALIALLVIVLTGTLIALFNQSNDAPVAPSSSASVSSAPPSSPPPTSPSPSPTSTTVQVNSKDFKGLTSAAARDKLERMGLAANVVAGNGATSPDDVDHVYDVNPTGPLRKGTEVTVKYFGPLVAPNTPTDAPTQVTPAPPALAPPGSAVDVSWPAQSCPSGQTLSGYKVVAEGNGAAVQSANPTAADVTKATVTAGTGDFTVKYSYFCGQIESDYSPTITVNVTP